VNEQPKMDLFVYDLDEYSNDSRQGNKFAPSWPFRLAVAGSSDSGKTTMIINLLMGDKKAREDGNRYVLCDAVLLVGRYLDEPKWTIVREFFEEQNLPFTAVPHTDIPEVDYFDSDIATLVIFEDLMDLPNKVQDRITGYFTHGRHKNVSCIYVAQRFFAIPKAIRENVNYISLHGGHGSLADTKRIIRQYTEESESLAPVIDNLTLQREFIVFDLRRSKNDPLSIRVRWDTSLRSMYDQSQSDHSSILDRSQSDRSSISDRSQSDRSSISDQSQSDCSSISVLSKFTPYGQKAISEAKKNGWLLTFARNFPLPLERKSLLVDPSKVKNSGIWAKYVFREAYGVKSKELGEEWKRFLEDIQGNKSSEKVTSAEKSVEELFSQYKKIADSHPLSDKKIVEGIQILLQIFSTGQIDRKSLATGINKILQKLT
jgi:hypothetical protein